MQLMEALKRKGWLKKDKQRSFFDWRNGTGQMVCGNLFLIYGMGWNGSRFLSEWSLKENCAAFACSVWQLTHTTPMELTKTHKQLGKITFRGTPYVRSSPYIINVQKQVQKAMRFLKSLFHTSLKVQIILSSTDSGKNGRGSLIHKHSSRMHCCKPIIVLKILEWYLISIWGSRAFWNNI